MFTADQLNELFVNARKQLFRATIPALFDIDDAVFHYCFTEFTAGTDQRAKNTYPYSFCQEGSKWDVYKRQSQYRDDLNEPYKPTGELGLCTIMVKNSKFADFTVVKQMEVSSNVSIKQDIAEWLSSGTNSVKITIKGENTDQTTAPVTYRCV